MKRLCLWGTSLRKVGDEAQFLAVCEAARAHIPDAAITIFARPDGAFAPRDPRIQVLRTARLREMLPRLARADLLVFVGGPFMESPAHAMRCLALVGLATLLRRRMIVYGATILGYTTRWGRLVYTWVFQRMGAIAVREESALARLRALGLTREAALVADPRWLLTPASPEAIRELLRRDGLDPARPLVGITTRHLHARVPSWVKRAHQYSEARLQRVHGALGRTVAWLGRFAQVVLIPMHPSYEEDLATAEALRRQMPDPSCLTILSRRYRAPELLGIIRACDMLIASRLSSAVFAALMGTPTLGVAYEARMLDHMTRLGCQRYVREWQGLEAGELIGLAQELWVLRGPMRERLRARAQALRDRARREAGLIAKWCGGMDASGAIGT